MLVDINYQTKASVSIGSSARLAYASSRCLHNPFVYPRAKHAGRAK